MSFLDNFVKRGGIKEAVDLLKEIPAPNDQVERIFNNLIERNVGFYDDKQEWLKQVSLN